MSTSKSPSQRRYPPEPRVRAVRMVREAIIENGGERFGVVTRVARQLGIGAESLRTWVKQAEVDEGQRPGMTSEERRRIAELEKENRELRRANEILKSASAFMPSARLCRVEDFPNSNQPSVVGIILASARWGVKRPWACTELQAAVRRQYAAQLHLSPQCAIMPTNRRALEFDRHTDSA